MFGAYSTSPDLGSPVLIGKGRVALTARCIVLLSPAFSVGGGDGGSGTNKDKNMTTPAATQATTVACT